MRTARIRAIATRIGNSRQNDRFRRLRCVLVPAPVPVPAGPALAAAPAASAVSPAGGAPVSGSAAGLTAGSGSCGVAGSDASAPGVAPRPAPLIGGPPAPARHDSPDHGLPGRSSPGRGSRLPDQDRSRGPTPLVDPVRHSFELSAIAQPHDPAAGELRGEHAENSPVIPNGNSHLPQKDEPTLLTVAAGPGAGSGGAAAEAAGGRR